MQHQSIPEPVRLENERTYLQLKPELRQTLYIAAWAITAVMGVAGVTTYYSSNPSALGAVMALLLFLGFLLIMKSASALLFDPQMPGMLRFLALLCIIAVVVIDVFAFSHEKQTGVMERIESAKAVDTGNAERNERIRRLETELAACPPNHYTKCRTPLLLAIQDAQIAPDTLTFNAKNAGENRYWLALAEWYNEGKLPENQVDAGTIALYVFSGMGFVGSLFAVFAFGVHGASVDRIDYTSPTLSDTTQQRVHERNQPTYRQHLEAVGVTVPRADKALDKPILSPVPAITNGTDDERTSTLSLSESSTEDGGDKPQSDGDTYERWKEAVRNGQCDTIVRDMRIWLQDVGAVEPGKTKQAQLVAESFLVEAQAEGFIREVPNWVSGMRRKYEWTGKGANRQ